MRLGQLNIGKSLALKYFLQALDEIQGIDDWSRESEVNRYISVYYREQLDFQNSLKYAKRSLEVAQKSNDPRALAYSWREMAYNYYETPEKVYWKEAEDAYKQVIQIYNSRIFREETDPDTDLIDQFYYMVTLVNVGLFYYDLGDLRSAIRYLNDALQISFRTRMTETAAFCYKQLGLIYQQQSGQNKKPGPVKSRLFSQNRMPLVLDGVL